MISKFSLILIIMILSAFYVQLLSTNKKYTSFIVEKGFV